MRKIVTTKTTMTEKKRVFPINTATACQAKWAWSSLYLNTGITASCHRSSRSAITAEDFDTFHNTDLKLSDRKAMLRGEWPEESCSYCQVLEENGNGSDRTTTMNNIPNVVPEELYSDASAIEISPTIVEVFFNNTCNLGCLYCHGAVSSVIESENRKFGTFNSNGVKLETIIPQFKNLLPSFWRWFDKNFKSLKRFQILGGEPFYQKEFYQLLDKIDENPNPNCELSIVTNLMLPTEKLEVIIQRLKKIVAARKIKRVDITCSIDCWGLEQEFVRDGLDLELWERNFNLLVANKWLYLSLNHTITVLTIKTLPDLLKKLIVWRTKHKVGQHFTLPSPGPSFMQPYILNSNEFKDDFDNILELMPQDTQDNINSYKYMESIKQLATSNTNVDAVEVKKLFTYLDEMDRRRSRNWEKVFPWLTEYRQYVV